MNGFVFWVHTYPQIYQLQEFVSDARGFYWNAALLFDMFVEVFDSENILKFSIQAHLNSLS